MAAQEKQLQVTRTAKMVKDVHKFIETLLGASHEHDAQAYCREATKLGYGTLDYINKKTNQRPRITTAERLEPATMKYNSCRDSK